MNDPYQVLNISRAGSDADLLLLEEDLSIHTVIAGGRRMMEDHVLLQKGTYEI